MFIKSAFWKGRLRASGIHLGISLALAVLAALLVFLVWYPYPYREISGGRELFLLVVSVDVIMGPLLTLAVFNVHKSRRHLGLDLAVVGLLQVAALAYGLWTVALARPVHLAYEIDRFRVVHAIDVPVELLAKAPADLQQLPLTGPTLLSVRDFNSAAETFDATMAAVAGVALGTRPDLWQSYAAARSQIQRHAKPLADLKKRFPDRVGEIDAALKAASSVARPDAAISYVPLAGHNVFWTVLIDASTTGVIAFVPIDSF